jgi:hypothetical protein
MHQHCPFSVASRLGAVIGESRFNADLTGLLSVFVDNFLFSAEPVRFLMCFLSTAIVQRFDIPPERMFWMGAGEKTTGP